jgi:hypothetical protein
MVDITMWYVYDDDDDDNNNNNHLLPYFSIDNARVIYTKRSKFVKK